MENIQDFQPNSVKMLDGKAQKVDQQQRPKKETELDWEIENKKMMGMKETEQENSLTDFEVDCDYTIKVRRPIKLASIE